MDKRINIEAERELKMEAALEAVKVYPTPDTPHTSIKMRAEEDRAAFMAGFLAARSAPPATGETEDLLPLPAGATSVKTWRERYREEFEKGIASGEPFLSPDECKDAEITELRAAMRDAIAHYLRKQAGQIGQIVAWRCNRLDHAGKVVQHRRQDYPNDLVDTWEYVDDLKVAAELRGERGYKACPSHVNWQPLYGPAGQEGEQPTIKEKN